MADDIQASLREKTIQNHRLDSKVGELEIRMSHLSEDLAKACAERDRSQDECKELSRHLLTVCEELKDVTTKYEALKLMVPLPSDHKRKRDADADDQSLGPAFEQRSITHSTPTNVSNSPYDSEPTTPKRLPTLHYRSTSTISTDTSPCASPGPENSLRGTGGLPPPWLQTVRATTSSPQPGSVSTRSNTPNVLDSQRTTDPRKRLKVDANQTPTRPTFPADQKSTPTPSNTTPQTGKGSPISNKMPRTTPTRAWVTKDPVAEGPRIPSEYRKKTISLSATPLRGARSSPRRISHTSPRRISHPSSRHVALGFLEEGELPQGKGSSASGSSSESS